jgi:hypothetical protein
MLSTIFLLSGVFSLKKDWVLHLRAKLLTLVNFNFFNYYRSYFIRLSEDQRAQPMQSVRHCVWNAPRPNLTFIVTTPPPKKAAKSWCITITYSFPQQPLAAS